MSFDEQPDDPYGECRHEIKRLQARLAEVEAERDGQLDMAEQYARELVAAKAHRKRAERERKVPTPLPEGARLMTTAPSWWRKVNGADYIIGVSYHSEAADETTYVCAGRWDGRITLTMCSDSMDRSPSGCRVKHVAIADSAIIRAVLSRASAAAEPTPTGEPPESWEAWARREAPGDDSGECNEITLRVRFEMALRNLRHLRTAAKNGE